MLKKMNITIPELTGDEERRVYIYLPESYRWNKKKRYVRQTYTVPHIAFCQIPCKVLPKDGLQLLLCLKDYPRMWQFENYHILYYTFQTVLFFSLKDSSFSIFALSSSGAFMLLNFSISLS